MRATILIAESSNFSEAAVARLQKAGYVILADVDRQGLLSVIPEAEVLWVRLRHHIDAEILDSAPRLKVIASATTGLNHIDLAECDRRGIRVISLRGETEFLDQIYATAEHTLALALALVRNIPAACQHVTAGGWDRDSFRGRELHGKTAGIIGFGRVGRMVAGYFHALGMNVLTTDTDPAKRPTSPAVRMVSLHELLDQSDLLSLHLPFTESTRGFFGASQFARMKPGAWFVNTSRGEIVDQQALLDSLHSGRLAGAALDVLAGEQSSGMAHDALVEYARHDSRLIITPHIAGCTLESMEKTENFIAEKIAAFLQAQPEETCIAAAHPRDIR